MISNNPYAVVLNDHWIPLIIENHWSFVKICCSDTEVWKYEKIRHLENICENISLRNRGGRVRGGLKHGFSEDFSQIPGFSEKYITIPGFSDLSINILGFFSRCINWPLPALYPLSIMGWWSIWLWVILRSLNFLYQFVRVRIFNDTLLSSKKSTQQ